jgi:hypothetical protein
MRLVSCTKALLALVTAHAAQAALRSVVGDSPSNYPTCDETVAVGDLCSMDVTDVIPTQGLIGLEEVQCKVWRYQNYSASSLASYLVKNPLPGYWGPEGIYITDGHHQARALYQADVQAKVLLIQVAGNFGSDISVSDMLNELTTQSLMWLYDDKGNAPMNPFWIPTSWARLANWPYRSLAWAVRNNGGYLKTDIPYADFMWGNFFANHSLLPAQIQKKHAGNNSWSFCAAAPFDPICYPNEAGFVFGILGQALKLAQSLEAAGLPGYLEGVEDLPNCGNTTMDDFTE